MRWKDTTKRKAKPSITRSSYEGICKTRYSKPINQVRREKLDEHYAEAISKSRSRGTLDRIVMSILKHHRMNKARAIYRKSLSVINSNGLTERYEE